MICSSDIINGLVRGLFNNSTITRAVKSLTTDSILISSSVITSVGDSKAMWVSSGFIGLKACTQLKVKYSSH